MVIFTVSLTEHIQIVDGLSAYSDPLIFEMQKGEIKMLTWGIVNIGEEPVNIEFYVIGPGSELLVFEDFDTIDKQTVKQLEVFVSVPKDHKDNIEFRPILFALQRGDKQESGGSGMVFNVQVETQLTIKIGNNPVYTAPETPVKSELPPAPETKVKPKVQEKVEETIEEKMARIQAANEAKTPKEKTVVDDAQIPSKATDQYIDENSAPDDFVSEPIADPEEIVQEKGGCLIATAAYGSEMAPQIQFLREIRDNTLQSTISGTSFMSGFNQLYYSFSPTISDWERENPVFKEAVKTFITPMLSTLSIMTLAEEGSESQVLGLGISVITLNLGMYIAAPAIVLWQIRKRI